MSSAKHSYASVTDGQTDRRTDGQTDDGQSDTYVSLCFAGDTKTILKVLYTADVVSSIVGTRGPGQCTARYSQCNVAITLLPLRER